MSGKKFVDYYRALQVDPHADPEIIEAAYKRLARKYHPDVNPAPDATVRMQEINLAFEALRDSTRRAEYHARWEQEAVRARPAADEPGEPPAWWPGPPPTVIFAPAMVAFRDVEWGQVLKAEVEVSLSGPGRFRGEMHPNQGWVHARVTKRRKTSIVVEVQVDTTLLRGGLTYQGSVVFLSPVLGPALLPVRVAVRAEPRPSLRLNPEWLNAGTVHRNDAPSVMALELSNAGSGELEGEILVKHAWLNAEPDHFVGDATIRVTLTPVGLKPGRAYTGKLEVTSNGGLAVVPVKVQVARDMPPLPPEDSDDYWPAFVAQLKPVERWERDIVEMISLQVRQRGWKPTSQQQALLRRIMDSSENR